MPSQVERKKQQQPVSHTYICYVYVMWNEDEALNDFQLTKRN